jgi:predicted DNA-binding protein (MmcQ/YjbR family)
MNIEQLRKFCLSLPHVTEDIKWGSDLTFCIGEKMFAITSADSSHSGLALKCTPETFAELIEIDGIAPSAYIGRYHWVRISKMNAITTDELKELIQTSYNLVRDKLPKKVKDSLA